MGTEKEILKIIENAIKKEAASENLYRRGMEVAMRREVKDIFAKLAGEEAKHAEILRGLYRRYKKRLGLKILRNDDQA